MERLREALAPAAVAVVDPFVERGIGEALRRVQVAVVADTLDPAAIPAAGPLRWLHVDIGGAERWARPEVLRSGLLLTSSAGRSAPALAEHVFHFLLSHVYRPAELARARAARRWDPAPLRGATALAGRTLGLVGLGATGLEVAKRAAAFDLRVLAYRRRDLPSPPGVERVWSADRGDVLDPMLREADFLVLAASLTDRSRGLIGARELALLRPSAVLVNIARGDLVDEAALAEALRGGALAGAGLDAFASEPLPRESPLWTAPGVQITPHATPLLRDRDERSLAIVLDNLDRHRAGRPLRNALTPEDAYSGPDPAAARRSSILHRAARRVFALSPALRRLLGHR